MCFCINIWKYDTANIKAEWNNGYSIQNSIFPHILQDQMRNKFKPVVQQLPDARLSWAFVVKGFIGIISKVKMQEKNTERLKFHDLNICPYILHADADARGIAIALLHLSAGALIKYM